MITTIICFSLQLDLINEPEMYLLCFLFLFLFQKIQTRVFCDDKCVKISGLSGILYYETLTQLYDVTDLKIFENKIHEIETGAICSLPTLKKLELNFAGNPQAPTLTKYVFFHCRNQLQHLYIKLDFEKPSKLEENALQDLNLKTLSLEGHKIGILKKNFIKLQQESLVSLFLKRCYINEIEDSVFSEMSNLEELEISYNKNLTKIPQKLFLGVLKLKRLFLDYNRIRDLSWDEFEGLTNLEILNLSGNRILNFDANKFSELLPNLKYLEIKKNLWPCKLKENFAENLVEKMNDSVTVVFSERNSCL